MGTRSHIGILHKTGKIDVVFCHWDGYLSGNGVILLANYNTLEKVKELISKGSFASLDETIAKTDYYNEPGWDKPFEYPFQRDYLKGFKNKEFFDIEFTYLFDERDNKWLVAEYPKSMKDFISLEEALNKVNFREQKEQEIPVTWTDLIKCYHEHQDEIIDYILNTKESDTLKETLAEEIKTYLKKQNAEQKEPVILTEFIQFFHEHQNEIIEHFLNTNADKIKEILTEKMKVFSYDTIPYIKDYYDNIIYPQQKSESPSIKF